MKEQVWEIASATPQERARETQTGPGPLYGVTLFGGVQSFAGPMVTEETALSVGAFLAGVRLIANSLAMSEIDIYNGPADEGRRENTHPVYSALNSMGNPWSPSFAVRVALYAKRLIHGNAYAEIVTNPDGTIELWPLLDPEYWVTPYYDEDEGGLYYKVTGYGGTVDLPPERVLHLRGFSINGFSGLSLLSYCKEQLGLSRAMDTYAGKSMSNGSRPGGYIQVPGKLGPIAYDRLKSAWTERHSGSGNANRFGILEEGAEWKDSGINPNDMQLIESRQMSIEDFARVLGIPLSKLRVKGATAFSNQEEDTIDYVTNSLMPLMVCDEQELTHKLLGSPYTAKYDLERLLTVNTATRDASFGALRRLGVLNIDDIRRRLRMPPLPNNAGQTHLQEVNLAPVSAPPQSVPAPIPEPVGAVRSLERYSHIDFTPPEGARDEARKGLAWREEFNRGGTAVGVARARDIANGVSLSPETIGRMVSFFARHEVDKKGQGFSPGEEGFPSAGRIAWALWGGDPGQAWANKVAEQMDAADEKAS